MTHEQYLSAVRAIAAPRVADPVARRRLLDAKLVYGSGERGARGTTYFESWQNGRRHDFLEVCATGEESALQLAGTTIHELAHCLAGREAGHGAAWRAACRALGLIHAEASGQSYALKHLAPDVTVAIAALEAPTDGRPAFARVDAGGLSVPFTPRPCRLGIGTRGGRSRGLGAGSRLRLWRCACGVRVRVASDDFRATCDRCHSAFTRTTSETITSLSLRVEPLPQPAA